MKKLTAILASLGAVAATGVIVGTAGAATTPTTTASPALGITDTSWRLKIVGAQYQDHLWQFHRGGTFIGSNPTNVQEKAGVGVTDSTAQGTWEITHGKVALTFKELNADATADTPADDLDVTCLITMINQGTGFTGKCIVRSGGVNVGNATFTDVHRIDVNQQDVTSLLNG